MCMLDIHTAAMEGPEGESTSNAPRIGTIPDLLLDLPVSRPNPDQEDWPVIQRRNDCGCNRAECSADSGFSEPGDYDQCPHCGLDCGGGCRDSPSPNLLQVPTSPHLRRSCSNEDSSTCSACRNNSSSSPSGGWDQTDSFSRVDHQRSSFSDLEILARTERQLAQCGYYYGSISNTEAREKLRKKPHGTFLVRDSSHQKYLYAISTQTERGATSVRVEYRNGAFRLDCELSAAKHMPTFDCVIKLIDHYVSLSSDSVKNNCVWLESSGRRDTPVVLRTPLSNGTISRQTELPEDSGSSRDNHGR